MIHIKIEKINDKKIKCTLTKEDLENKNINLSELAYGSEKAKALFREMMDQAHEKFNVDFEGMSLMVEAVPMKDNSLVLFISGVENPDELDTRFSRFTNGSGVSSSDDININDGYSATVIPDDDDYDDIDEDDDDDEIDDSYEIVDDDDTDADDKDKDKENTAEISITMDNKHLDEKQLIDVIGKLTSEIAAGLGKFKNQKNNPDSKENDSLKSELPFKDDDPIVKEKEDPDKERVKKEYERIKNEQKLKEEKVIFVFKDMKGIITACKVVSRFFNGYSSFYKNPKDGNLYIYAEKAAEMDEKEFGRFCMLLGEYGVRCRMVYSSLDYFDEHFVCIRRGDAIETLAYI